MLHVPRGVDSEGKPWSTGVRGRPRGCVHHSHRGQDGPLPTCVLSATEATPGGVLSLVTLSSRDFWNRFIPLPRKKKKKTEFREEVKVVFNGRETHKNSVKRR